MKFNCESVAIRCISKSNCEFSPPQSHTNMEYWARFMIFRETVRKRMPINCDRPNSSPCGMSNGSRYAWSIDQSLWPLTFPKEGTWYCKNSAACRWWQINSVMDWEVSEAGRTLGVQEQLKSISAGFWPCLRCLYFNNTDTLSTRNVSKSWEFLYGDWRNP